MDGIVDVIDSCPLTPEVYNYFEDTDGCPDSVSDELTSYQFPDTDGELRIERINASTNLKTIMVMWIGLDVLMLQVQSQLNHKELIQMEMASMILLTPAQQLQKPGTNTKIMMGVPI